MKHFASTARRWRLAGSIMGLAALVLLLASATALVLSLRQSLQGPLSVAAKPTFIAASTRPVAGNKLVQIIGQAAIHQIVRAKAAAPKPKLATTTPVAPAVAAKQDLELVATYRDGEGQAYAYVRRQAKGRLLRWARGTRDGGIVVAEIGEGYIVLDAADGAQTLRIERRNP